MKTAKLVELNYQGSRGASSKMWGIHAAGCKHLRLVKANFVGSEGYYLERGRTPGYRGMVNFQAIGREFEASSMKEALDHVLDSEVRELGWSEDNVNVPSCVAKAIREAKRAEI